jgi:predicted membrane channel-forming protein YqfA (hemolysin III family)
MIPTAILLLPSSIGLPFITLTTLLCIWTCIRIFQLRPSVWRQVVVAASCLPFLPFCYFYMNRIEWFAVCATIVLQASGVFVFVKRQPDLIPHVFGYHELFHVLVVCAGMAVYLVNWSIIHRTCNPYDLHTDVAEILWHIFVDPTSYR